MIREIVTNVGNFGKFNDIKLYMRDEKLTDIDIKSIRFWNGDYLHNKLLGVLTFAEILAITEIEV